LRTGAAGLVDDDDRLLHQLVLAGHPLNEARHLVGAAAGAGGNDELDRLGRLPRGRRYRNGARNDSCDQRSQRYLQLRPLMHFHFVLLKWL